VLADAEVEVATAVVPRLDAAATIDFSTSVNFTLATAFVQQLGQLNAAGSTYNLNGHTVTGLRWNCNFFANIFGSPGGVTNNIPGSVNGSPNAACTNN